MRGPPAWFTQPFFGAREGENKEKKKKRTGAPFTIFRAEIASSARFWWLGALSKRKRACAYPLVRPSKMSIAWSTWASRWLAVNHPSLFLPGQKMTRASLSKRERD